MESHCTQLVLLRWPGLGAVCDACPNVLVVFLSLIFWGWLWGPVGMFLSVPLTMILKIGMENSRDLKPIAIMLDSPRAAAGRLEAVAGDDDS